MATCGDCPSDVGFPRQAQDGQFPPPPPLLVIETSSVAEDPPRREAGFRLRERDVAVPGRRRPWRPSVGGVGALRHRWLRRSPLACDSLVLATFCVADLHAPPASFGRLTPFSPPSDASNGPSGLSFSDSFGLVPIRPLVENPVARPAVGGPPWRSASGRLSHIHAGFSTLDFLGVRFGHAERNPPGIETALTYSARTVTRRPPHQSTR